MEKFDGQKVDEDPGWEGIERDLAPKIPIEEVRKMLKSKREGTWGKDLAGDKADPDIDNFNADDIPDENPPMVSSPRGSCTTTSNHEPVHVHASAPCSTFSRKRSSGGLGPIERLFDRQRTDALQILKFGF